MKLYCSSCGADNSYTMQKPKFCQKCGDSLDGTLKASRTTHSTSLPEEERDADVVPNINKLDFDISGNQQVKGVSLEALSRIQTPQQPSNPQGKANKKVPRTSKKKVLEQFQKEAGAIRPNNG